MRNGAFSEVSYEFTTASQRSLPPRLRSPVRQHNNRKSTELGPGNWKIMRDTYMVKIWKIFDSAC